MLDEGALLAVAAVLIIVAVSLLAPRVGVAAPILLVVVGLAGASSPASRRWPSAPSGSW
ncbi:MAG TPA: hypothetical protein PJ992_08945 [Arachnia sp.]|jgi:CPA1 family monovalent cation:H+ antiporter|nr:hypothetical protein [Arachnia sp.]HMR13252.1 hypothetical protein [Arachnia sp.]